MRILLLAPHPFYQPRGTPIAVDLILQVLSNRGEQVDVLTFHEGQDLQYGNVTIFRTPALSFLLGVRPGYSWKKLICDALLAIMALRLVFKNHYDVIHAVEESVFVAVVLKWVFGIPFVYDMDSSLAQQMREKYSWLGRIACVLNWFERMAIRQAQAVIPVCQALAQVAMECHQENVMLIHDVPLSHGSHVQHMAKVKEQLGSNDPLVMYVGNLEIYQGIDLLLESFAIVVGSQQLVQLAIIGGESKDIDRYSVMAERLDIQPYVHFLGPKSVGDLASYLAEADVLVSPRIQGNNTPMKVYSYMESGVPVVATNLVTHTQVMDSQIAELVPPTPRDFAAGILGLLRDKSKRERLGKAAQEVVKDKFSYEVFSGKINTLYDWLNADGSGPFPLSSNLLPVSHR